MKKKYIILSIALGMGVAFSSCSDYLKVDKYFKDRLTEEKVFASKVYCDQWLTNVYTHLTGANMDVASKEQTMHNFSDDMYFGDRNDLCATFRNGLYKENFKQGGWASCYIGIRDASTMIQYIDINTEMSPEEVADYKAQARFLRAYYYWLLLRKYGPIPILPEEGLDYMQDYDELARARNTYDECADYISNELALAAKYLPLKRSNRDIVRPTRGAALAARAKVLLYAASPIANPRPEDEEKFRDLVDDQGRCLIAQEYNEYKWARAAAAAKDVIELGVYHLYTAPFRDKDNSQSYPATIKPPYDSRYSDKSFENGGWADIDPFESYRAIFNGDVQASDNPELIFTRGQNQNGNDNIVALGQHQMPFTVGGWNCHGITLKQCDAYYMNNGGDLPGKDDYLGGTVAGKRPEGFVTAADVKAGKYKPLPEGVALQYADREPRFYASVAYNGSIWDLTSAELPADQYQQIWYYRDFPNGKQPSTPEFHLRTGIGIKKYYNPQDSYIKDTKSLRIQKVEPAIRYAEVLLIYAEALNELDGTYTIPSWDGGTTYSISRETTEMSKAITPVRVRAGLPDYDEGVYSVKSEFRKKLKRERQIELFAEGHRYYDLRRWKDAPVEEAQQVYGCNMNLTSSQRDAFYQPTVVSSLPTVFVRKMYFWPISHDELRRNRKLTQNPGWTYYD